LDFDVKSIYSSIGINDISTLKEYVVDGVLPKGFKPIIKKPKIKEKKQQVEIETKTETIIQRVEKRHTKLNDINRLQIDPKHNEGSTRQKLDKLENNRFEDKVQLNKKRKFELPLFEKLNKEQSRILKFPEDGQFLIVGGPGTGKSIVALLRSKKYQQNKIDYQFLVYNHVLNAATNQLASSSLKSWTLQSWLWIQFFRIFSWDTPKDRNNDKKADYKAILDFLQDEKQYTYNESTLHIIIDEGQDAPKELYDTLWHMGIVNFFIVADQNQQITDDNSSRKELEDILGIETNNVIELTKNYRNSDRIAIFAQHFYTDPSSPPPDIPHEKPSLDTPTLYEYQENSICAKLILRHYDKDTRKLIGVITNDTSTREVYMQLLNSIDVKLDNKRANISTYSSDTENKLVAYEYQRRDYRQDGFVTVSPKLGHRSVDINFSEGGIVVLTDKSVKGLEFDIVFIVVDDFNIYNNDLDVMKKRFYVMSSRAMEKLVLLKDKNYLGNIETILPNEETILKREKFIMSKRKTIDGCFQQILII